MSELTIDDFIEQGDVEEGKKVYQELCDLYEREPGEKDLSSLEVMNDFAGYYRYLGAYNIALQLYEKNYDVCKEILGENHLDTLFALHNLANFYCDLGYYNTALQLQYRVFNEYKETLGVHHPDTLSVLQNLANSYSYLGAYTAALEIRKAVYYEYKETLGENHLDTLSALSNIANSCSDLGCYNIALKLQYRVFNVCEETLGENHPETLSALNNLANSYSDLGNYKKALELNNTVYNARKEIQGEHHLDTLSTLNNLASSYYHLGDYNKELQLQNTIYSARKEIQGANHPDTLSSLSNLARSYFHLGDYDKELQLQNMVYNARKEHLGENHPDTLSSLSNLASSYFQLGDYNKALQLQNTFYNARKEILGVNHLGTLEALYNLSIYYSALGNYNKALELNNIVYNARKEILGEKHPDTLWALNNLASSCSDLGDYNTALELNKTVYDVRKIILGEKHPDTLLALNNLASSYSALGDYAKALELQNTVYTEIKDSLGEKHPDTLTALVNLAVYYSKLGYYDKAVKIENKAYNARKKILGESHPDTLRALSLLCSFSIIDALISMKINKDKLDDQSIKKYMIAYFENINNFKTTAFNIKKASSRRHFLKVFNNIYELLKLCVFDRKIKGLLDYIFINKNLSFEMDVSRFHNETMGERLSLEEVSHMISNQLIIDFYELNNSKYGLILIKKGKYSFYMVDYPDILNGLFVNDQDIKLFIGSIEDYDHIYICPDGELYNVSFERVLDCLNISYLSSVQTLFKKNMDDDHTDQLVSFVYPDFSGTQSEDNDRGDTKGVLYGSYLEGMFIHDIYGEKSTIYSSYQANHDNFFNTKRPRILHVSTHGDYLDNEHMEPMDRGILCLSGYNVEENDSGYISAREIQYMDLKGTELAVLSACNTGLGENISGEGIYGIRRAFELAGCQTLLLTVEEVDDFNSAIFMKSFYERYNQTNNIYQSFRNTKEYLKEYGLVELKELRDVFEKEMKNKIKNPFIYKRSLNELNKRIEESETIGQIVRKKNGEYVVEDWNGFIIQGKIEN